MTSPAQPDVPVSPKGEAAIPAAVGINPGVVKSGSITFSLADPAQPVVQMTLIVPISYDALIEALQQAAPTDEKEGESS